MSDQDNTPVLPIEDRAKQFRDVTLAQASLLRADGSINRAALCESVAMFLAKDPVTSKEDKESKAILKERLVKEVIPSALGPGDSQYDADEVVQMAWDLLLQLVWDTTKTDHTSKVQSLVGNKKRGYVMCRTKIARNLKMNDAVYVTNVFDLIVEDFGGPLKAKYQGAATAYAENMGLVANRQPSNRRRVLKLVDDTAKTLDDHTKTTIRAALTAGTENGNGASAEHAESEASA